MPDEDDDPTQLPEGFPVVAAADSDDGTADQAGEPPTPELLEELLDIAWTVAADAQAEGVI